MDKNTKFLIVGLGLIGGSYAKTLKKQGFKVAAITKNQEDIDYAVKHNIIDFGTTLIDEKLIKNADIIVFALYPHIFVNWIKENGHLINKNTIITDVTGVKTPIVKKIQNMLPCGVEFIAAHPMAGKETCGVKYSSSSIFKNANYIVVPTEKNTEKAINVCKDLGSVLGFKDISVLSPEAHDEMIAFLSQLTHCIAISLMCANDNPALVRYTGDSFRDLTRIANINDEMWSELFIENKTALLREMDAFKIAFDRLYSTVRDSNREEMRRLMRISTKRRKNFNVKKEC